MIGAGLLTNGTLARHTQLFTFNWFDWHPATGTRRR
jgi:hypothetical protein